MGAKKKTYSFDTKVAAVRAVEDEAPPCPAAMARFGIVSSSPLRKWLKAYREGGPEALRPRPKGRPKGAKAAPGPMAREQELERRVQKLEAENAYLKKIDRPEGGEALSNREKAAVVSGLSGRYPSPICWRRPGCPGRATTTRSRIRRRPRGPRLWEAAAEIFSRTPTGAVTVR